MPEAAKTVFVTGGTGFVGRRVVASLVAAGRRVRVLVRPGSEARLPEHDGVEARPGDIRDRTTVIEAARSADAAVHLVGILREKPGATFRDVHVRGTENVVHACRTAGVRRLVHMSALGVARGVDTPYLVSKQKAEDAVLASGIDQTILRPSIIHGPRGDFMVQMARMVSRKGPVPLIGGGRQTLQPVWVGDIAELCLRALDRPATAGRTYEVGGPQVLLLREFFAVLSRVLRGRSKTMIPIPTPVVRLGAWLDAKLSSDPPITPDELKMLLAARPCYTRPMEVDFGLAPRPFEETLSEYADELKEAAGIT
jgi:NADH dehydrogenase